MKGQSTVVDEAIDLLKSLIATPSFSGEENRTSNILKRWLGKRHIPANTIGNNVWATNKQYDAGKPSILLNSHHDTVKPNSGYTQNPFNPIMKDGKLFGLGSNDAGGSLVSLLAIFAHYYDKNDLKYNLVLVASAEEEISGARGLRLALKGLPQLEFAIVGEPTSMRLAVAEKGLLVIDAHAKGVAGHAAHNNTENAINKAMEDIAWIKKNQFAKASELLGEVKVTVTQIGAGQHHNLVPAECRFVIDVRVNDAYTNKEVFDILKANLISELNARSFKHNPSSISIEHPIVQTGISLGLEPYGSPTISDQTALSCPSIKIGPGDSSRSHSPNEYIRVEEIGEGIEVYKKMLSSIL